MMKKILYIIAAGAMLLGGCSKESDTPATDSTVVKFSTEIATRASGTTWDNGDAIGVFMTEAGGNISTSEGLNASNVEYTTTGSAGFTTTTPIYYPLSGNVDFVAYYPYRSGLSSYTYKVDVATQTTPAAIDLLYSNNATGKSKSTPSVALTFDHKLSRVVLNIKAGEGMTDADLAGVTVKITGMPTTADFKLADGTFGTPSTVSDITPIVATTTSGFVATYTAILVPQAVSAWSGRKMVFTVGSDVYEHPIPYADDFASGKNYPYAITVSKTGISVSQGTITDWTGTTDTPGDLGEVAQIPIPQTVKIPEGAFLMGSPTSEPDYGTDETQHSVKLTNDFYMSKYTITNAQYAAFLNANNIDGNGKWASGTYPSQRLISASSGSYDWGLHYSIDKWEPASGFYNHPIINVTWYGGKSYCEWLSEQTGGTWRLPTEAEWEYACRGDYANKATEAATKPFGLSDGTKLYSDMANFEGNYPYALPNGHINNHDGSGGHPNTYLDKTEPVGSYSPNNYGLYDMHGNVWEWCSDWYDSYDINKDTDPTGPNTGDYRVIRGGGWDDYAQHCRSAYRFFNDPAFRANFVGFRVVFVP